MSRDKLLCPRTSRDKMKSTYLIVPLSWSNELTSVPLSRPVGNTSTTKNKNLNSLFYSSLKQKLKFQVQKIETPCNSFCENICSVGGGEAKTIHNNPDGNNNNNWMIISVTSIAERNGCLLV